MIRRLRTVFVAGTLMLLLSGTSAMACPNCKLANETDSRLPRAYMYSILFMIGMPATIFTGFGLSFYRMTKNAQANASSAEDATEA